MTAATPASPGEPLRGVRRLGLLGGSFDPVHAGHLHVAREAQRAFGLDHVLFVPAARPPHKPDRILAEGADRLAMLEIALRGRTDWSASDLELRRGGTSYTVDTVRSLPAELGLEPGAEVFLVIGSDNLEGLPSWREARALLELVRPIVIHRGDDVPAALDAVEASLGPRAAARLREGFLPLRPVPISSTELRAALGRGEDPGADLPPGVREYALERGLYRGA